MNVVININPGQFQVSPRGLVWLHNQGADVATPVKEVFGNLSRKGDFGYIDCMTSYKKFSKAKSIPNGYVFSDDGQFVLSLKNIERTDKLLVALIETLREEANGPYSDLRVIEIPDDILYTIEINSDGVEFISEEHRTWP